MSGNTYNFKTIVKQLGGFFDKEEKVWIVTGFIIDRFFNTLWVVNNDVNIEEKK
jgi:hypothetical protein